MGTGLALEIAMSCFVQHPRKLSQLLTLIPLCFFLIHCAPIHKKASSLNSESSEGGSSIEQPVDSGGFGPPSAENPPAEKQICDDLLGDSFQSEREEVCQIVLQERQERGLAGLELDAELSRVAQDYAEEMANKGFFSHTSPEGEDPGDRLRRHGVRNNGWGENIAQGYQQPSSVMRGWMNSSGHRANILTRGFDKVGIGVYKTYWVQVFITD